MSLADIAHEYGLDYADDYADDVAGPEVVQSEQYVAYTSDEIDNFSLSPFRYDRMYANQPQDEIEQYQDEELYDSNTDEFLHQPSPGHNYGYIQSGLAVQPSENSFSRNGSERGGILRPAGASGFPGNVRPFTDARHQYQPDQGQYQGQLARGSNPRNTHGVRLRPVSELPDVYRGIFKFGVFNAVQSTCFDDVMHSDENMIISAPTGSGKTVLFELAIIRMLSQRPGEAHQVKCVYVAPTKALCSERYRDWTAKFEPLGIKCCELTGDTVLFGKSAWGEAKSASVIITTVRISPTRKIFPFRFGHEHHQGEKWDSLTRNWRDSNQILSQIQLFLVDEVHILNESRGSTLEVVIARMKIKKATIRFLLVSATAPNINDIASWIGNVSRDGPALVFEFGEEFRPCKLTRFVYSTPKNHLNDFAFATSLDRQVFPVLQQHSQNKPILIFAATRKGVVSTAEKLMDEYEKAVASKQILPWTRPKKIDRSFHDKRLEKLAQFGIGVHHAGLSMDDRRATEDLYLGKILRVVVSTSTLAVGVNLPAHTVVIKGVKTFQGNGMREYSDLDIIQMMGRAGRPQFDKEGVAIVLCEPELEGKYKSLAQGKSILESCLHLNLSEHLNSEVGLGTITNINTAKEWLHSSFLYQRIQKNPTHYAIGKAVDQSWQHKLDDMVLQTVTKLKNSELIAETEEEEGLCSTDYGDIMAKFYIRESTMSLILKLPERASIRELLEAISNSEELSDIKIRSGEKQIYKKLRDNEDIRYKPAKVEKPSDKIFLLIQSVLGGISLNSPEYRSTDSQPQLEAFTVFRHISRIAKAIAEVAIVKQCGLQIKNGLELARCLAAKAWEDRPVVMRQIEHLGEKSLKVLAENGIKSIDGLRKEDPLRIELLLNRRPPFGHAVLSSVSELPQYYADVTTACVTANSGKAPVQVDITIECGLIVEGSEVSRKSKQKPRGPDMTSILTLTSDGNFIDYRRISTKQLRSSKSFTVTGHLTKPSQSVVIQVSSEAVAGINVEHVYKPQLDPSEYPTMNTRPPNSVDIDRADFRDGLDFCQKMDMDSDKEKIPVKDLTKIQKNTSQILQKPPSQKAMTGRPARLLDAIDSKASEPKQLPSGNYECNHVCKDKTKCLHLCCRNGISKPPPPSKKRHSAGPASQTSKEKIPDQDVQGNVQVIRPEHAVKAKPKPKNPQPRPDNRLQELESLHQRSNVALKLPEGQRLKLEARRSGAASKPRPNFDFEFTDLNDEVRSKDTDDDNLPEPKDLLEASRHRPAATSALASSTEEDYSDSEFDALIRDMPLDQSAENHDAGQAFTRPALGAQVLAGNRASWSSSPSPSPVVTRRHAKRTRPADQEVIWPAKRPNFKTSPAPSRYRTPTPSVRPLSKIIPATPERPGEMAEKKEALFLPDYSEHDTFERDSNAGLHSSAQDPTATIEDDEGFVLDETLFDVVPSGSGSAVKSSDSSSPGPSSATLWHQVPPKKDEPKIKTIEERPPSPPKTVTMTNIFGEEETIPDDDPLAEFEAWLASGAVEIVPSLDL